MAYLQPTPLRAGNLIDKDPGGYEGIPWGSSLSQRDSFTVVDDAGEIIGYDRKEDSLRLGQAPVDYVRYVAVGGKLKPEPKS